MAVTKTTVIAIIGLCIVAFSTGKKHASKKYDQFDLNTSRFWGKTYERLPQLCNLMKFFLQK